MSGMTPRQFSAEAVPYLVGLFPTPKGWLQTTEQIALWYQKCCHVVLEAFLHAINEYATENTQRPTITALAAYFPQATGAAACVHTWDPLAHNGQVVVWSCKGCGKHHLECPCQTCVCPHRQAELDTTWSREGIWWYWCPDCQHTLRLRQPLALPTAGEGTRPATSLDAASVLGDS
jgi:hypothetical protein